MKIIPLSVKYFSYFSRLTAVKVNRNCIRVGSQWFKGPVVSLDKADNPSTQKKRTNEETNKQLKEFSGT